MDAVRAHLPPHGDPHAPSPPGESSPHTGRKLGQWGCQSRDPGQTEDAFTQARSGCVQTPRRRWWNTGLALTSSHAEANRRHRPEAEEGGTLPVRGAWLPGGPQPSALAGLALLRSASPWTTRPGLDYGLGCQGHVQGTFQLWNKMSEEGQGPSLSVQGWGRGAVAKPRPSLWEPANSHTG